MKLSDIRKSLRTRLYVFYAHVLNVMSYFKDFVAWRATIRRKRREAKQLKKFNSRAAAYFNQYETYMEAVDDAGRTTEKE